MTPADTLIRPDLEAVPALPRRLARLALQLFLSDPDFKHQLSDSDFLIALWQLTKCLLYPDVAGFFDPHAESLPSSIPRRLRSTLTQLGAVEDSNEDDEDEDGYLSFWGGSRREQRVERGLTLLFRGLTRTILGPLVAVDGDYLLSPTAVLLGRTLRIDPSATRVLDFLALRELTGDLRQLMSNARRSGSPASRLRADCAAMLDLHESELRRSLNKSAPLRALGLVRMDRRFASDLGDFLQPTDLLSELLEAEPDNEAALLALLIEPAPAPEWSISAFPHLQDQGARVRVALGQAASQRVSGVNALFYGPPGTGKTELARTLIEAAGLNAYQVRDGDDDDDALSRSGRLSAYLLAQRLLAARSDAVIIFDEVEDVIAQHDDFFSLLAGHGPVGHEKGWMNRILEANPVPAIWITNHARDMDPAFQRRFLLPVAFVTPPRSVRRQMAERHLGDLDLPPAFFDELAKDDALVPAQLGAARRLVDLQPEAPVSATVQAGIASLRQLLHGAAAPPKRESATAFDVAYLNLAGGIHPSALVQALEREGEGRLCFYGPPGTGKTAFAEVLATALDRELVVRQASDLISPYVGQTEKNLAELFLSIDPERSVLLLDEVDSFLGERRQARYLWERTQVNELLQQIERFPGIFIAATNLMSGLDTAALRRFDFKLQFRALNPEQRLKLFAREALGDVEAPVEENLARHLEMLNNLTPGDFANVCRQQRLLGERLAPESFLRRLIAECRLKEVSPEVHR